MCRFLPVQILGFLALAASCATSPAGSQPAVPVRNTLTGEEVRASGVPDAYAAVRQLRSEFLNRRGTTQFGSSPVFYIDGARVLDATALRSVSAEAVGRIDYIGALEATRRFGSGHSAGAILVMTRPLPGAHSRF